jgi:transcriptional regulator with XRE-family HTH domain
VFGKRLAELRAKMGISQYELAQRLHFSRGQIANYEQGTREPDFQTLVKIADFFDVSLDYLLGRTKYGEPYVPRRSLVLKNTFFVGEVMEELSDYEVEYLKESLDLFRKMNKKQRDNK